MAWIVPSVRATGDLITAAIWNQDIKDNTRYLKGLDGLTTLEDSLVLSKLLAVKYVAAAADVVTISSVILGMDSTVVSRTVTLPSSLRVAGRLVIVKDEKGTAATNNITIATEGTERIDGSDTFVINTARGSVILYSDGTDWFVVYAMGGGA